VDGRPFLRQGHPFFCLKAVLGGLGVILGLRSQEKNYTELGLKGSRESPFSPQTRGGKKKPTSHLIYLCATKDSCRYGHGHRYRCFICLSQRSDKLQPASWLLLHLELPDRSDIFRQSNQSSVCLAPQADSGWTPIFEGSSHKNCQITSEFNYRLVRVPRQLICNMRIREHFQPRYLS
jgi:hypothetical protein